MNMDGPEQDKVYWTIWGVMVAVITIIIIVAIILSQPA